MTEQDFKEIESRYFIFKKHHVWYAIGGAVAFLGVVGLVSWQSGKRAFEQVVQDSYGKEAVRQLQSFVARGSNLVETLQTQTKGTLLAFRNNPDLGGFVDERITNQMFSM